MKEAEILNARIYTIAEVARMAKLHPTRVRRWLHGYTYEYQNEKRRQGPVVGRAENDGERYASFLDLMEIRVAKQFIDEGLSLFKVRNAFSEAAKVFGQDHPFARRVFYTRGKQIFLQVGNFDSADVGNLLHLFHDGQWAISDFIVSDATRIEFDPQSSVARRWWPLGKNEPVVIDPAVGFGAATLKNSGIKTLNVYRLYKGEGESVEAVARWLKIRNAEVGAAIRWEEYRLSKAA